MKFREAKLVLVLLGVIVATITMVIVEYAPSTTDYSIYNSGWNGLSKLVELGVKPISIYDDLIDRAENTTLIVIPRTDFREQEIQLLKQYLLKGGILIIADDTGRANKLLSSITKGVEIVNITIRDPGFYYKSPLLPLVNITINESRYKIVLNVPGYLEVSGNEWRIIGRTSKYSFIDLNNNGIRDPHEPQGPFPIVAYRDVGLGRLYVVSDPDFMLNSMLNVGDNVAFINNVLANGREVYIDVRHLELSVIDNIKSVIFGEKPLYAKILWVGLLLAISLIAGYFHGSRVGGLNIYSKLASVYVVLLVILWFLLHKDLLVLPFLVIVPLLITRRQGYVATITTSGMLYLGRNPVFMGLLIPLILFYPRVFRQTGGQYFKDFFGSSSFNAIRTLGLLFPVVLLDPSSMIIYLIIISVLFIQCLWNYVVLGRIELKVPTDTVKVVLGKEALIQVLVKPPRPLILHVKLGNRILNTSVKKTTIVSIPYRSTRLGYQVVPLDMVVEDLDGISARRYKFEVGVNVIPSTRLAVEILESSLKGLIEIAGAMITRGRGGVGLGELGRGVSGRGGVGRGFGRAMYIRFYPSIIGAKGRRGEYFGVRYYVPGDDIRTIHWKKTLTRGELVVKEYSSGIGGGGRGSVIVFADLIASNIVELDKLAYMLVSYFAYRSMIDPTGEAILFLTLPDGNLEILHGKNIDVLSGIVYLFSRRKIFTDLNYTSIGSIVDDELLDAIRKVDRKPMVTVRVVNEVFVDEIVDLLYRVDITPPTTYTVIYGKPTTLKYSYLRFKLREYGYQYVEPITVPLKNLRRIAGVLALMV